MISDGDTARLVAREVRISASVRRAGQVACERVRAVAIVRPCYGCRRLWVASRLMPIAAFHRGLLLPACRRCL